MQSKLPFQLELNIPHSAKKPWELEILIQGAKGCSEKDLEGCDEMIQIMLQAINLQMFNIHLSFSVKSFVHLQCEDFDSHQSIWRYHCEVFSISIDWFPVLINMLWQMSLIGEPITQVVMKEKDISASDRVTDVTQLIQKLQNNSPQSINFPFRIEWIEPLLLGKNGLQFTLEFREPVTADFITKLDGDLNVWNHIVFLKGYDFSDRKEPFFPIYGHTHHQSPRIITHRMDAFPEGISAILPVLFLLVDLHTKGHVLEHVIVE